MTTLNFRSLEKYGINTLTGEACAFSMRTLCDLNEDGAELLASFFGIKPDGFQLNWNSKVNGKPAIGSVMLCLDAIPSLLKFIAFAKLNAFAVVSGSDNVMILESQEQLDDFRKRYAHMPNVEIYCNYAYRSNQPSVDGRNVHAMTGRAA